MLFKCRSKDKGSFKPRHVRSDKSFGTEERKKRKWLLPGLPAPPCASMQLSRECPAVHHTSIADRQGGKKGEARREGLCAYERVGWDMQTQQALSFSKYPPPPPLFSSLPYFRLPKQVIVSPLSQSTCPALPSELSECCTVSLSESTRERDMWEQRHH